MFKKLVFIATLFWVLAPSQADTIGIINSQVQDMSVTNVPTAFTTAGAQILTFTQTLRRVECVNDSPDAIFVCFNSDTAANCTDDKYLPATSGFLLTNIRVGPNVWVRSATGVAIVSGILECGAW